MREQKGCLCPLQAAQAWAVCLDWGVGPALGEKGKAGCGCLPVHTAVAGVSVLTFQCKGILRAVGWQSCTYSLFRHLQCGHRPSPQRSCAP